MTVGCSSTLGQQAPKCGCITQGWPAWAFGARARGWQVVLLVIKEDFWTKSIREAFPAARILVYESGLDLKSYAVKINIWFSDIDPPRSLALWSSSADVIITSRRARHVCDPLWQMFPRVLTHSHVGGATDGEWTVYIYLRVLCEIPIITPTSYRDLSAILDTRVGGIPCPPPPNALTHEASPKVVQLRPNTYHGGGLLPWCARSCFVIAPCIFSPTSWVRRRCTLHEALLIFDIPGASDCGLSQTHRKSLSTDTSIMPLKVIIRLLDILSDTISTFEHHNAFDSVTSAFKEHSSIPSRTIPHIKGGIINKLEDMETRNSKAAKNDDAPVPEYLWNDAIVPDGDSRKIQALTSIRSFALRWWWKHTTRDFLNWLRQNATLSDAEYQRNKMAGADCIHRCCHSTWWEWTAGSRPLFWRWPAFYRRTIRDGLPPWIKGNLPRYLVPQRAEKDDALQSMITSKLKKVRDKGYIVSGEVRSLTSFFTVPKGDGDVRMVYDATKSGLNGQLWAPWFLLPTIESHLRSVEPGSYMGDIDFSEQFLNFILHEKIQPYAGVDVSPYFTHELTALRRVIWERWSRCGIGFVSSPYTAVQGTLIAEEVIRGHPKDYNNVFRWDEVILNLPGSQNYRPWQSWVFKVKYDEQGQNASMANDLKIYVDDVRTIGSSYAECRQASRVVASLAGFLGLQDAPRKRRDPSMTPGPWAGSIVHTSGDAVMVSVSQERWNKAKAMIAWIKSCCSDHEEIEFKTLESYRGFLIYITRTYPSINPYLKGIHLTLDSWRPWRTDDSWKMTMAEIRSALQQRGHAADYWALSSKPPTKVRIAPRLHMDIIALDRLFNSDSPPYRQVRPSKATVACYMFGDASGAGFGSSLEVAGNLHYVHGQWNIDYAAESSNYRELANLIFAISNAADQDLLVQTELFVFTDNSTAGSAFFKGTSSSKRLFELMLSLRELEMHKGIILHMVHVAGKRMISQGTDGLSRGDASSGVMAGVSMLSYVPLHLSAMDRGGAPLFDWILSWFSGSSEPRLLTANDWFYEGHMWSTCIWCPPPAAANTALEQLAFSTHKRPASTHLVLIPRLMTAQWRKLLGKICCLVFTIPIDSDVWPLTNFEPLIVGLYLPLSKHYPWNLRGTPMLERVERMLRDLSPSSPRWGGLILRELLFQARSLESLPSSMVRELLQAPRSK